MERRFFGVLENVTFATQLLFHNVSFGDSIESFFLKNKQKNCGEIAKALFFYWIGTEHRTHNCVVNWNL